VIAEDIQRFLLAEVASGAGADSIDPDTDLIEQRIVDSLTILKLVTFLEESCGIAVLDEDIVPENFRSVNSLVRFVEQRRGARNQEGNSGWNSTSRGNKQS
jgi:acyl carrier protein